ncbi:hypothetical protein INT45_011132 [Circinella minor]|uniref:Uncharacterized protein n=1 Tax=Circinella minor TaxID=1195481 RepID=A0A8H7SEV2_9FUNG|nr:hypothetical protein INT45_011132 [Circinella minor]
MEKVPPTPQNLEKAVKSGSASTTSIDIKNSKRENHGDDKEEEVKEEENTSNKAKVRTEEDDLEIFWELYSVVSLWSAWNEYVKGYIHDDPRNIYNLNYTEFVGVVKELVSAIRSPPSSTVASNTKQ